MSEYKCAASIDGVCHNQYGFGTPCNGYSENAAYGLLTEQYKLLQKAQGMQSEMHLELKGIWNEESRG